MKNYKNITIQDIVDDAKSQGSERISFLKNLLSIKIVNKNGKEYGLSFIQIKREYYKKFYPEFLPVAKPKAPTMKELVFAL